MKKRLSILSLCMFALICSCKKENSLQNSSSPTDPAFQKLSTARLSSMSISDISVQDGRLTFATTDAFQNLMQEALNDTTNAVIKNTVNAIAHPNFVSYSDWVSTVANSNNLNARSAAGRPVRPGNGTPEMDQDSLIDDPLFNQVVNASGEIQVENTVYKITPNGTFATVPSAVAQLNAMLDAGGMLLPQFRSSLQTVDQDAGNYKVNDDIYLTDTYGVIRTNRTLSGITYNSTGAAVVVNSARPCYPQVPGSCNVPTPTPVNSNDPFSSMDIYPFESKKGFWGALLENIFGDPHYNYYRNSSDRRLKVNFSSKNWLVYASLGVRAVIQKKNTFLFFNVWGPVDNKDEMRLGWTPLVFKLDIPAFTMPGTTPPQDPFTVAGKMLAHSIKINLGGEYTTLRVSDVLDANTAFPFLPAGYGTKLNDLSFDVNAFLNQQKNSEIDNLFKIIKKQIGYTAAPTKLAFINNDKIMIDGDVQVHNSSAGNGVMSKTFTFNTAIVGFSSTGSNKVFIFKPAKKIELVSGGVYAVGKLNGEWKGIAVKKE